MSESVGDPSAQPETPSVLYTAVGVTGRQERGARAPCREECAVFEMRRPKNKRYIQV